MNETMHTLRPALLVSLSTSLRGNVSYIPEGRETSIDENGQEITDINTKRIVADPQEQERAVKARTTARGKILAVCASSAFGLMARESDLPVLQNAIREAREGIEEFNATAQMTRIQFNVIYGRIAADDAEAVKAISEEVRNLMEDMVSGVAAMDVKQIRDNANKLTGLKSMLSRDASSRAEVAIEAARQAARRMVKAGENAAIEIDRAAMAKIDMARTAFLDIDIEQADIKSPVMSGRALEL